MYYIFEMEENCLDYLKVNHFIAFQFFDFIKMAIEAIIKMEEKLLNFDHLLVNTKVNKYK